MTESMESETITKHSTTMKHADLSFIEKSLKAISDREYQLRVWHRAEGPEVDWFEESLLSFDTEMDYFKHLLRKGETSLEPSQVKAVLRVHIMTLHFCEILDSEDLPKDWSDEQLYIINHPYWRKIQRQAADTLFLLNDKVGNKPLRTYGSIETRTATRHPMLDDRFRNKMKVFADPQLRMQTWKGLDDFWNSVHAFNDIYNRYFNGGGMLNGWHYKAMIAFDEALEKLCKPYEDNEPIEVGQILSDPRFREVEQKAQDFLALSGKTAK